MAEALVVVGPEPAGVVPASLVEAARGFAAQSRATNTIRAYRSAFGRFVSWATAQGLTAMPATGDTVALYISHLASEGRSVPTLEQALAAIAQAHKAIGHPSPRSATVVQTVMSGIRRSLGVAATGKSPVLPADLRRMLAKLPSADLRGLRDRAMLLLGFAGALRRSELVGLDAADVREVEDGLEVTIRRSKTDQEAAGRKLGIPYGSVREVCPVRALREWRESAGVSSGPLFREITRQGLLRDTRASDRSVARLVKRAAQAAGLNPGEFSGHSLRAGFATAAAKAGKSERAIQRQTGHRSAGMLRRYIREATLFDDNAATGLL